MRKAASSSFRSATTPASISTGLLTGLADRIGERRVAPGERSRRRAQRITRRRSTRFSASSVVLDAEAGLGVRRCASRVTTAMRRAGLTVGGRAVSGRRRGIVRRSPSATAEQRRKPSVCGAAARRRGGVANDAERRVCSRSSIARSRSRGRCSPTCPAGKVDWKPHPKSMQFGYLAQLVAMMPVWIVDGLRPGRARSCRGQHEAGAVEDGRRSAEAARGLRRQGPRRAGRGIERADSCTPRAGRSR